MPDTAGMLHFRNLEEAAHRIEMLAADCQSQSRLARALAEEYFDCGKAASALLTFDDGGEPEAMIRSWGI